MSNTDHLFPQKTFERFEVNLASLLSSPEGGENDGYKDTLKISETAEKYRDLIRLLWTKKKSQENESTPGELSWGEIFKSLPIPKQDEVSRQELDFHKKLFEKYKDDKKNVILAMMNLLNIPIEEIVEILEMSSGWSEAEIVLACLRAGISRRKIRSILRDGDYSPTDIKVLLGSRN
jgi:hypothetical protein